jgi:hypothetical protein
MGSVAVRGLIKCEVHKDYYFRCKSLHEVPTQKAA